MSDTPLPPLLRDKDHAAPSAFTPESLLREAQRQKGAERVAVPPVCLLDPDGDVVRALRAEGRARRHVGWVCYHTDMWVFDLDGHEIGVVGCAVGASFAVLVAEEMFASGCHLLISVTSSGQITPQGAPPYFILIDRAWRDEGTSYHYLPPGDWSAAPEHLLSRLKGMSDDGPRVFTGPTWTTEAYVDESMITGEPVPVAKAPGDAVTGGTVNGAGSLHIRATRVGADTTLAQIIRMVEQAQGAKLPIQGLVDRITLWFVPVVMAVAALTVAIWLAVGPDPAVTLALVAGVSVLIIARPCTMGLATLTSIMVGTGRAADMGVLFRKGDALQALASVDVVALDKTGTVTEGRPEMTDLVLADGFGRAEVLSLVAAVEGQSEHPMAEAITRAAQAEGAARAEVVQFESITGYGVQARVAGHDVLVGADRLMAREGLSPGNLVTPEAELAARGRTALYAAIDGRVVAVIAVADPVKSASAEAIRALHAAGLCVAMIIGDKRETAEAIAREVGIDTVIAGVLPDDKVAALDELRKNGSRVAFVGDGINDAPALAHADVGIAIGTGTDVAIESAVVVLMSGDLRGVVNAVQVSRHTMRNIRQNLFWAFGYNTALIPVAAGVLYPVFGLLFSPVLAAGVMALSSVFVLSNALRLRRLRPVMDEGKRAGTSNNTHSANQRRRNRRHAMNIGDIAPITNLPAKTIRYYEDIGLVNPARDDNAYRRFNDNDVHKLGFIGRARSLGFTIEDCRALLALYEDKDRASADVKQIAQHHLDLIDAKIAELKAMRTTLGHLIESCAGDHRPDCPILEDLAVISQKEPG